MLVVMEDTYANSRDELLAFLRDPENVYDVYADEEGKIKTRFRSAIQLVRK
jgi:hypothetical protein